LLSCSPHTLLTGNPVFEIPLGGSTVCLLFTLVPISKLFARGEGRVALQDSSGEIRRMIHSKQTQSHGLRPSSLREQTKSKLTGIPRLAHARVFALFIGMQLMRERETDRERESFIRIFFDGRHQRGNEEIASATNGPACGHHQPCSAGYGPPVFLPLFWAPPVFLPLFWANLSLSGQPAIKCEFTGNLCQVPAVSATSSISP
jgi:hypothetical protein